MPLPLRARPRNCTHHLSHIQNLILWQHPAARDTGKVASILDGLAKKSITLEGEKTGWGTASSLCTEGTFLEGFCLSVASLLKVRCKMGSWVAI